MLITDEFKGYLGIETIIDHGVVEHKKWFVDGLLHTNGIEGFWALLKRGIIGQYHKVSKHWLDKYIDEFCYRYNNRKRDIGAVFHDVLTLAVA